MKELIEHLQNLYSNYKIDILARKGDIYSVCYYIKKQFNDDAMQQLNQIFIDREKSYNPLSSEGDFIFILLQSRAFIRSRISIIKENDLYIDNEFRSFKEHFITALYQTCLFEIIFQGYISEYYRNLSYYFYKGYYFEIKQNLNKKEQVNLCVKKFQSELKNKNVDLFFDDLYFIEKDMPNKKKTELEVIYEDIRQSLGNGIVDVLFIEYCKAQFRLTSNFNPFIKEQVEKQNQLSNKLDMCRENGSYGFSKKDFLDIIKTCFVLDIMCQSKQIGSTHELHWELYCQFLKEDYFNEYKSQEQQDLFKGLMMKYEKIQQVVREFTEKFIDDDDIKDCPIQIGIDFWYHIHIRHIEETQIKTNVDKATLFPDVFKGTVLWTRIKSILLSLKEHYKLVEEKPLVCFGVFLYEQLYIVIIKNNHLYTIYPQNAKTEKEDRKRKIKEYLKDQKKLKEGYEPTIFINEDNLKEYIK